MCAWNCSCSCTFTQLTCPHISTVGSFHIFEISHTCVIMLCSHITLKTPTKPQLYMQYTTTTYTFFLQPLPVPSSLSVNNPLCHVYQTHTSVLENTHTVPCLCWKKDVRSNCGWVLVCDRASSFPETKEQLLTHINTHKDTYTRCIHSVWNWECLYSLRNKTVSCVYDCLCFSWPEIAGLAVTHSLWLEGWIGLSVWTRHSNFLWVHLTVWACLSLSALMMTACSCCIYQAIIDVLGHPDGKKWWYN